MGLLYLFVCVRYGFVRVENFTVELFYLLSQGGPSHRWRWPGPRWKRILSGLPLIIHHKYIQPLHVVVQTVTRSTIEHSRHGNVCACMWLNCLTFSPQHGLTNQTVRLIWEPLNDVLVWPYIGLHLHTLYCTGWTCNVCGTSGSSFLHGFYNPLLYAVQGFTEFYMNLTLV